MSSDGNGEKTEKPTPQKIKEGRKQGQVPRSSDLAAWAGIGAAAAVLPMVIRSGRDRMSEVMAQVSDVASAPEPALARAALSGALVDAAWILAPLGFVTVVVAIGATVAQGGMFFATKKAKPDLKRLDPLKGLKNKFTVQTLWEGVKVTLKTAVLGVVLYLTVQGLLPMLVGSGALPLSATTQTVLGGAGSLIRAAVIAGVVLAAFDYLVSRRQIMKQLRMSHKEIKDEHKQSEGDPMLKGAIRSKQMAMSRNRMMAEVAQADVVLVNPTHVAVALRYEPSKGAPRVVAKGAGHVAARIREKAAEHRVPMVEDVPLARALHSVCELNQEIPADLYNAVAQVLAFVMRLRSRGGSSGVHKVPQAAVRTA
ncbi:EscU/YscU/HrcU family type III secretion system export apparatus switch protein [Thalassiella azotivora]